MPKSSLSCRVPRNLWDPTFNDDNNGNPWIFNELGRSPITILGRLQAKINTEFPGMKIAITEYENGGWNPPSRAPSPRADNLGIFGSQGVYRSQLLASWAVRMLTFSPGSGRSRRL